MLAYSATAQLALCQFPGAVAVTVLPTPPRFNPHGIVTIVDVVPFRTYGTRPIVGQPFALIVNNPFIYTSVGLIGAVTLLFIAPSGKVQLSDNRYVSINTQRLLQNEQITPPQYVVYMAGGGEFNEIGVWRVVVQTANAQSAQYFFTIVAS